MKSPLITVLTPTYNRACTLKRLYESLVDQTDDGFVWLVSDDGSVDGTEDLVRGYAARGQLPIEYVFNANGGKHRAVNRAMTLVHTELTFIVDSDDKLPKDAIDTIRRCHEKYAAHSGLCGYSFLRSYMDGTIHGKLFPVDGKIESYFESRINGRIGGDKAEVFFTERLREFPFREYTGESFLNEDTAWMRMAQKYDMVHINKAIYTFEYVEGGLTKRGKRLKTDNPLGGMERGRMLMSKQCRLTVKWYGCIYNIIMGKFAGFHFRQILAKSPIKPLTAIFYPAGWFAWLLYSVVLC